MNPYKYPALGFVIGMLIFGTLLGNAIRSSRKADRFVTVRGLSEREVPADLAIWPLTFTVSENDLTKLQDQIQKSRNVVRQFLLAGGFKETEISNAPPQITDADSYEGSDPAKRRYRYRANVTVLLKSSEVAKVKVAMETCDKLVQQGIALGGSDYMNRPQYHFTGLNQIKPAMIQEATQNARQAAEKFAEDSKSKVTIIRRAYQGQFEINDLDSSSPDRKTIRVVTTVDYFLE